MSGKEEWRLKPRTWYETRAQLHRLMVKMKDLEDQLERLRKDLELAQKHTHMVGAEETGPAEPPKPRVVLVEGRYGPQARTVYD